MAQADSSARLGWHDDAAAITQLQLATWETGYGNIIPMEYLAHLDPADMQLQWEQALSQTNNAKQRILVALERVTVVGFATCIPAVDQDLDPNQTAEFAEITIHPEKLRQGHGSRILHALVDTARADRFNKAVCWLGSTQDAHRQFLTNTGWAADGATRTLDLLGDGQHTINQIRLHTDLTE